MAAHLYWRCSRIFAAFEPALACGELQFRSAAGANLSIGGEALASSYLPGNYWGTYPDLVPAKAFDGRNASLADIWHANTGEGVIPQHKIPELSWIGYRFVVPADIGQVAVAQRSDYAGQHWLSCNVDYSDDGVMWAYAGRCVFPAPTSAGDLTLKTAVIAAVSPRAVDIARLSVDADGGRGAIVGSVASIGPPLTPLARRVLLISERLRRVVRETWSTETGAYRFDGLPLHEVYTVVCHDNGGLYKAVVADGLVPVEGV